MTKIFRRKAQVSSKIKEMDWLRVSCSEVSGKIQHCPQSSWMKKVLKIILTKFGKFGENFHSQFWASVTRQKNQNNANF